MTQPEAPHGTSCPVCGKGHLVPLTQTEEFEFDLGEEKIMVRAEAVPVQKCDQCGEVLSGPAAAQVRHAALCRAAGFLTSTEYQTIREKLGWSQQFLADLTGFGVATISRLERGRLLPNRSYHTVLLALRDCPPFQEYLKSLHESRSQKREDNQQLSRSA